MVLKMKVKNVLLAAFVASILFVSCANNATENKEKQTAQPAVAKAAFACPMDCEKGKVYDVAGTCPVCKMDLVDKNAADSTGQKH
jgi:uncharacterized protein (DUF983 family)